MLCSPARKTACSSRRTSTPISARASSALLLRPSQLLFIGEQLRQIVVEQAEAGHKINSHSAAALTIG